MADFKFSALATIDVDGFEPDAWDESANKQRIANAIAGTSGKITEEFGTGDFRISSMAATEAATGRPIVLVTAATPILLDMILESDHVEQPLAEPTA